MAGEGQSPASGPVPAGPTRDLADEAIRRRIAARLFGGPSEPVVIGRFVVRETLGRGGAGVVYAADDPQLGRVVALKMLRDRDRSDGAEHVRLLREARALARLSHPNVVQVFEVGETADGVFIAMERVDGLTLAEWLAARPRPLREVLEVFVQAARGLAAAHAVGLLHRDFKPGNALVGADGRVRIVDFGLARTSNPASERSAPDLHDERGPDTAVSAPASRARAGTPAYMSPEQRRGDALDVRSDVFSFCVALFEATHGARPFTLDELGSTLPASPRPQAGHRPPRWLRRLLARGLAPAREQRFASMVEVADAMTRAPLQRRRLWTLVGLAALLPLALLRREPDDQRCAARETPWDVAARRELSAALESAAPALTPTRERVLAGLDAYAAALTSLRRATCEATTLRGERSPALMDRAMLCIDRGERSFTLLVELLRRPDPALAAAAGAMVAALPPLARCSEREDLLAPANDPEDPRLLAVDADLQRAELLRLARRPAEALRRIAGAVAVAQERGDPRLEARALLLRGRIEAHVLLDRSAATRTLHAALDASLRADDHALEPAIWGELAFVEAELEERRELARTWLAHARAAARDPDDALLRAGWLATEAAILRGEGLAAEAEARADERLALLARALPDDHPERLGAAVSRGHALALRDPDAAIAGLEALRARAHEHLGAAHPNVAILELSLAQFRLERGDPDPARESAVRARAVLAGTYGDDHPLVASADLVLAGADAAEGSLAPARAHAEAALRSFERAYPRGATATIHALVLLAEIYRVGDHDREALATLRRLLALQDALGRDIDQSGVLINIGEYMCRLGRCAEARPVFERLLARLAAGGEPPALRAFPLRGLAQIYVERGEPAAALPLLTEALALLEADPELSPANTAAVARALARCHAALGHKEPQVRALIVQAQQIERSIAAAEIIGDRDHGSAVGGDYQRSADR